MEKEYIVGIDFGHGETSAWAVPLDIKIGSEIGESLKLKGTNKESERSYYSIIYYNPKSGYSLNNLRGNIVAGFKDKVSALDQPQNAKKREAYTEYIKQIYACLLKHNTALKVDNNGDTNFYLCIACPTKWSQDDKDAYIKFFNNALSEFGIEVMWVINESDAAYFTHGSIDEYADKCVLIIDYGSSTIDYTVVHQGKKISDDNWSNRLGASHVEESILNECRDTEDYQDKVAATKAKLAEINMNYIDITSCINFQIRKAKEYSVTYGNYPNLDVNYNLIGEQTNYGSTDAFKAEKRKYKFEIECRIDKSIEKYQNKVIADFTQLNTEIQKRIGNQKIDCVILSGGACLMPWVSDAVNDIFKPLNIEIDNQASFVVAKGIALYARTQMKALDDFLNKIRALDFSNIYIQADTNATSKAITTMMPSLVKKLKSKSSITGIDIRQEFCDFVENLNGNNVEYSNLVQQELDKLISNSVGNALKEVISSVFKTTVDTSDVKLHIPANIIPWNKLLFIPGGAFYDAFTNWIDSSSGRFFFTRDKPRYNPELSEIVEGTAQTLEDIVKSEQIADYPENVVNAYANDIKNQVLNIAANIFYKKQLFSTTFKK
jgi:molecular chaperone DnaK (HSP70)